MIAAYVIGDAEFIARVPDLKTPDGPLRSNNIAEYQALLLLLLRLRSQEVQEGIRRRYMICGDSQLVIRQMEGAYRVTKSHLVLLRAEAMRLANELNVEFRWIAREKNRAGRLLDQRKRPTPEATREN